MNHCGSCTMCCRLLGIQSLRKPAGVWCHHCTPGRGCKIHEQPEFPDDCREYVCLWRQMKDEGQPLPDDLRPDRCKVIIDAAKYEQSNYVRCDPAYPKAWQEQKVQRILAALENLGSEVYLITRSGDRHRLHTVAG